MRRRALLAGLAAGTTLSAGCSAILPDDRPRTVHLTRGSGTARPLDEPLMRNGLTAESGQYVYARLYRPGDSVALTGDRASWLAEDVAALSSGRVALLTNLRVAGAAPAYLWPTDASFTDDGGLRFDLKRTALADALDSPEAVGVALATFEYDGREPDGADLTMPGGATIRVGARG